MPRPAYAWMFALCAACASVHTDDDTDHAEPASDPVSVEKPLPQFTAIELHGSYRASVEIGDKPSITLSGNEHAVGHYSVRMRGKRLLVDPTESKRRRRAPPPIDVKIVAPQLDEVWATGTGHIDLTGLRAGDLELMLAGTVELHAEGAVEDLDAELNGTTHLDSTTLSAKSVDLELNGASQARVLAHESLDVEINGTGAVHYAGDATVHKEINGAGRVSRL